MNNSKRILAVAIGILIAAGACKQKVEPAAKTERIVCLSGGVTEIVYALGFGDQVVAVDASSLYPPEAVELATIGYHRQISAEGILSLKPDLILASEDSGPPEALEQIEAAGVEVRRVTEKPGVEQARERVADIAAVLGRKERGRELLAQMDVELASAREQVAKIPAGDRLRAAFIYVRGSKVLLAAGKYSPAAQMLELAGAENALDDFYGFKPLSAEALVAAKPDVIVMLRRGVESIGGMDGVYRIKGVALTPAGENKRIIVVDDALFSGFTHRLGRAVAELNRSLYANRGSAAAANATQAATATN